MLLAAHLPTYLPNLDFLYKLCKADILILADDLQYAKHGHLNRAKIKTARGAEWLTVPVLTKGRGAQAVKAVEINNDRDWRRRHCKTILVNYRYAAYFEEHEEFLAGLYRKNWSRLISLNMAFIDYLFRYFDPDTRVVLSSDLAIHATGKDWVFEAMATTGCNGYLAETHYLDYLNMDAFAAKNLDLRSFSPGTPHYYQQFQGFVSGLSSLDLLLNEGRNSREIIIRESAE